MAIKMTMYVGIKMSDSIGIKYDSR